MQIRLADGDQFVEILRNEGLLSDLDSNKLNCTRCKVPLDRSNISGLQKTDSGYILLCNNCGGEGASDVK